MKTYTKHKIKISLLLVIFFIIQTLFFYFIGGVTDKPLETKIWFVVTSVILSSIFILAYNLEDILTCIDVWKIKRMMKKSKISYKPITEELLNDAMIELSKKDHLIYRSPLYYVESITEIDDKI